jgi:hypothetical protein
MATPVLFDALLFLFILSEPHALIAIANKEMAWSKELLPPLFGPIITTACPRSMV